MSNVGTEKYGIHWSALAQEVADRTVQPSRHPTFVFYFLIAVAGIGISGLWGELIRFFSEPTRGLIGFKEVFINVIPALAAPTCMQLLLAERDKALRAFSIVLVFACAMSLGLTNLLSSYASVLFGVVSTLIALWLWWITNANQSDFKDGKVDLDAPTGGSDPASAELQGSLKGLKS